MTKPHALYERETQIMMVTLERGEIIISEVALGAIGTPVQNEFLFYTPAVVVHERPHGGILGFMLSPWIPNELLATPTIRIMRTRVVGMMTPSPEIVSFYKSWAETERDKLKQFSKEFNEQITEIEKLYIDRYKDAKKRKTVYSASPEKGDNDLLLALFEEDSNWGNPSITH